ncbi:tripartite motif-containing protein 16-like protein [Danio aesculapii]|uniref:tripartite motif-containing protein 16-like protein n=1 Tax=Danio aesculapii TaxID=1142201 RepID=UPI0024C0E584|nr:tripartite motif-containing protein 16-like protein [Danio aesculapii]
MAEASVTEEQFVCPVCLDLLKDPVTIPCGHSYCMSCITKFWDQKTVYSCPQCRQTYKPRPVLGKNTMLAEVVEQLKKTRLQTDVPAASFITPGDVKCDICTGRKSKAVKSCLVCLESYCLTHFEHHEEFHSGKRHKVTDAVGHLQQMMCREHNKILEVFCNTDQQYICVLCVMDEHRNHHTVSAVSKMAENESRLKEKQRVIKDRTEQKQKAIQQLREAIKSHKRSTQAAVEDCTRTFAELIRFIERSCSELTEQIRDQERAAVSRAEGLMERLKQEIDHLKRTNTELEQLSHTDCNHIRFLQSLKSLSALPDFTEKLTFDFFFSFNGVRKSVFHLKQKMEAFCKEEIKKISVTHSNIIPKTREEFLLYSHQLTLDPNTAHKNLCLSEENRTVTYTGTPQPHPDHPDRFDKCFQVLGKESVCGRCYWEVEWSNSVQISVSYKSISRKGHSKENRFGCNNQSWSLFCSPLNFLFWHNSEGIELPVPSSSCRIGVFVDHSAGTLTFYSISDTVRHIYRVRTTFTQPLYIGFVVGYESSVKLC